MHDHKYAFIRFAMQAGALQFGEFALSSGRISPYFFNSGRFNDGVRLARLGRFYTEAIAAAGLRFDMLFGPAYKGIPLVSSVAIAHAQLFGQNLPYCCDRKEEKDHGEGGVMLGAAPAGRVLIIDDVVTAGGAAQRAVGLIRRCGAQPVALAIALDRQERGAESAQPASALLEQQGLAVIAIICLDDLIAFLSDEDDHNQPLAQLQAYRDEYGSG